MQIQKPFAKSKAAYRDTEHTVRPMCTEKLLNGRREKKPLQFQHDKHKIIKLAQVKSNKSEINFHFRHGSVDFIVRMIYIVSPVVSRVCVCVCVC